MRQRFTRRALLAGSTATFIAVKSANAATPQATPAATPVGPAEVTTALGGLRGRQFEDHALFQGVRFGESTGGERRWTAPVPARPWSGVADATKPGGRAPQKAEVFAAVDSTDEDCLFLNVTVPGQVDPAATKPVMIWIHGGGGTNGSGDMFDARRIVVENDVVVVTINYRLGIFGSFGMNRLDHGGTFGLLDQQLAMAWVRDHIAAFGGDPGNVTLFGESYGALGISAHLCSPTAKGLFHRAIVQSSLALHSYPTGTFSPEVEAIPSMWMTADEQQAFAEYLFKEMKLDPKDPASFALLKQTPAEMLLPINNLYTRYAWGGDPLPANPVETILAGKTHQIPVLTGGTRDEARMMIAMFTDMAEKPVKEEQLPQLIKNAWPAHAEQVGAAYPVGEYESPTVAWAAIVTDAVWAFGQAQQNAGFAKAAPTWCYQFADRDAPAPIDGGIDFPWGASHASEVPYQMEIAGPPIPLNDDQWALARAMNRYWANFARTGDPNGDGLPGWDAYDGGPMVLNLEPGDGGIAPIDYVADHKLELWNAVHASDAGTPGASPAATPLA